jgi:hypothetical protein|nr:MAG TPA: hypothetical protein [Caudoviricetes sp.]
MLYDTFESVRVFNDRVYVYFKNNWYYLDHQVLDVELRAGYASIRCEGFTPSIQNCYTIFLGQNRTPEAVAKAEVRRRGGVLKNTWYTVQNIIDMHKESSFAKSDAVLADIRKLRETD